MKRLLTYSFIVGGIGSLTVTSYGQPRPATPITSIPFTITQPGKYVLQGDLTTSSPGDGISVSIFAVTIDFQGFSISTSARPNSSAGIRVSGFSDVVIQNRAITGYSTGIATGGECNNPRAAENILATASVRSITTCLVRKQVF
jgi:hypothetical protein